MMKNIVLIGFMGTGKTSTGKMLAARLGRAFLDMDQQIEKKAGKSIPAIFAEDGEAAFRAAEYELAKSLSEKRGLIISTGGGTMKREENRALLKKSGIIVCLTADAETILTRTSARGKRPVLDRAENRKAEIERLLGERAEIYAHADYTVDTSELSPLQVVEDIVKHIKKYG